MKKCVLSIVMILSAMTVAHASLIALFNSDSETLSSWVYTGTEPLTPSNVATGKINLLRTSGGNDYNVDVEQFKVRLACWNADSYCTLTILEVRITNDEEAQVLNADVNGDGYVTSADVTAIYDFLLNNDNSSLVHGDVNNDGFITSADITCVYDVLLGN